jgi:hypothetical protein
MSKYAADTPSTKLINFAALCAWLITSALMSITSLVWFGQDFRSYYAAARVLLVRGNPYDYEQLVRFLPDIAGRIGNYPYFYTLWFAWLMTPLARFPYEVARGIWMFFNVGIWAVGLWLLSKMFDWPEKGWQRWLMFLYATFLFAWVTWRFEQIGTLLFTLLVVSLMDIRKERWAWAGLWLALLLIKPNITLLPVAAILIWLIRRGKWQPLLALCLVLGGLLIITTAATPTWYQPFLQPGFASGLFHIFGNSNQAVAVRVNTTLIDWMSAFVPNGTWRLTIYIILVITGGLTAVIVALRSNSLLNVVTASVLISFAITPYTLQYDFPLLTLPLFWAMALSTQSRRTFLGALAMNAFVTSVLIWERPISDGYWMVIGLILLTLWSWRRTAPQSMPENLLWTNG